MHRAIHFSVCVLLAFLGGESVGRAAETVQPPHALHARALLVGINEYADPSITDLRGALRDVENVRGTLIHSFGFDATAIRVLPNASKAELLKAFEEHLIAASDADTAAVFYYSGHGSQVPDLDKIKEPDGLDETIVPSDSWRQGDHNNNDITDDELHALFARLNAKTKYITAIYDSCHSGSITRGPVPRLVPADTRAPAGTVPRDKDADEAGEAARQDELPYAVISGARANELSYEKDIRGDRSGVMTWYLMRALRNAGAKATLRDLMDDVKQDVASENTYQHPQLEGRGRDLVLFGATERVPEPYVDVSKKDNKLVLAAGRVHGVTVKSRYEVYDAAAKQFAPGRGQLVVEVAKVGEFSSELRIVSGKASERGRAVERKHVWTADPIRIFLRGAPESASWLAKLRARLFTRELPIAVETKSEPAATLVIDVTRDRALLTTADRAPRSASLPLDDDAVVELKKLTMQWARWLALHALRNDGTTTEAVTLESSKPAAKDDAYGIDARVQAGESQIISVRNDGDKRWFLSVVLLGADGKIDPLPGTGEVLEPKQTWSRSIVGCQARGQTAPSRDIFKVFLSSEPLDLAVLRQEPTCGIRAAKGPESPFTTLIGQRSGARGLRDNPVESASWLARELMVEVTPKSGGLECN